MPGFPEDCVAEDRSVAWLLAAREYPWLRSNKTNVHILPPEILRLVHRKLVGLDVVVFVLTEFVKEYFPGRMVRSRRIALRALNRSNGSLAQATISVMDSFLLDDEQVQETEDEDEEEEEEAVPQERCVRCRGFQPCHHCRRCVDCAFDDVFDPACLYCALDG